MATTKGKSHYFQFHLRHSGENNFIFVTFPIGCFSYPANANLSGHFQLFHSSNASYSVLYGYICNVNWHHTIKYLTDYKLYSQLQKIKDLIKDN